MTINKADLTNVIRELKDARTNTKKGSPQIRFAAEKKAGGSGTVWISAHLDTLLPEEREVAIRVYETLFGHSFENFYNGDNLTKLEMWVDKGDDATKLLKELEKAGLKFDNTRTLKNDIQKATEVVAMMQGAMTR
jgi:hypothetical protein